MTVQQEAVSMIYRLNDRSVRRVVEFMRRMPNDETAQAAPVRNERKAQAFQRLQELRRDFAAIHPGPMDEERAAAMSEKYDFFNEE